MRRRIQQLARGKFEHLKPSLSISVDKIDITAMEGNDISGDFVITSTNHVPMRGIVYSSNLRMECLTPQFEGEEIRIRYQFHSYGLIEGDIQKGEFCIVVEQGEYNLSFVVSVSKLYAESSVGKVKNLSDFARLSENDFDEAFHLFYSGKFKNIFHPDEKREMLLYEGLSKGTPSGQKVEEFLIGIHKKKRTVVSLEESSAIFYQVHENRLETFQVNRNQHGYLEIRVHSDAEFLVLKKPRVTDEMFVGSICDVEYYIVTEKMHAGRNFGKIRLEIPGQKPLIYTVCATTKQENKTKDEPVFFDIQKSRIKLMQLYLEYRLKRIVTGVWANQSGVILDHLSVLCENEKIYGLMKAQTLIINRQRQEASWILDDFKRTCEDHESPEWGYYLYLCTLMEREPSYVDRLTAEVEQIFKLHPDNSMLFWVLLFLKEEYYQKPAERLEAIRDWMRYDNSPYFYLEAYYLIWQDPYLLARLGSFEVRILYWTARWGIMTRDIAIQVAGLISEKKEYHPFLYHILEACYEVKPDDEMLTAVLGYLIRSQCFGAKYHHWYELGIEREIRITSLYEAYLLSLDGRKLERVPKMLQLYFQYDSGLSWQQKAVLFVNIIAAKKVQPEVYQKYLPIMERFAMEQMEAGHIDDNLAVIYDEMFEQGIINSDIAHWAAEILFTHKMICTDPQAAKIEVYEYACSPACNHVNNRESVIRNGAAYFTVYTKDYCLIMEDIYGNRFCEEIGCCEEPLMDIDHCVKKCTELAQGELSYILYSMQQKVADGVDDSDFPGVWTVLKAPQVSDRYKREIAEQIISFYRKRKYEAGCLTGLDHKLLSAAARRMLMQYLTEEHLYETAYRMAEECGYEHMDTAACVSLCSYAIHTAGFEEDDFLLGFAEHVFYRGTYNDVILIYLCKYYTGATKTMAEIWKAAGAFDIDTFDLEERILSQMLYSTDYIADIEEIYESYVKGGGRELICMAYLSYFADAWLVRNMVVPEYVFEQIFARYQEGNPLNDACKLGLLKYFSEKEHLSDAMYQVADELLEEYTSKNRCFAFFLEFEKELRLKYHLYDKAFVEYHTDPGQKIMIHFSLDGEHYEQSLLNEVYDGVFVKEFVLFFGESVLYYMTEQEKAEEKITESACLNCRNVPDEESHGRYEMLNDMLMHHAMGEREMQKREMKQYYGMQMVTNEVFRIL